MRKLLFITSFLLIHLSLQAQTERTRWTAGVNVGSLSYQSNQSDYTFIANLTPSAGYFASKNFLVGIGLPINISSSKYSTSDNHNITYGLSPFTRYYLSNSYFKPFIGLGLSYLHANLRNESSPNIVSITKSNTKKITPSIGLAYFINRNVSLDAEVGYNWATVEMNGSNNNSSSYTSENTTLTFGFNVFFGQ